MGAEARPKREEQEFLFRLFLDGYSDTDVLAKYGELYAAEKLTFPWRTDRRMIRQVREEFEAARAVLEPYLRQQLDPAFEKAREEHLDGVRARLEKWRDSIVVHNMEGVGTRDYRGIPDSFAAERKTSWFKSLNEHLPRPDHGSLWDSHAQWQSKYVEYLHLHRDLRQQIMEEARTRFNLAAQVANLKLIVEEERKAWESLDSWDPPPERDPVMPHVTALFSAPFFRAFESINMGESVALEFQYPLQYRVSRAGIVLEGLRVNHMEVLVAENVKGSNKSKYEAMVNEYLNNKKVGDLIGSLNGLHKLGDEIRSSLGEILERRDYIEHTCSLCPGSARA